ncbi:FAD-binding oxidoreductase [Microbacterium sp. Bi128]|uniref:FAD-binding oxidoreductase n=1 Tax=Microbacterium sp. Bi128 TaxID=2821115 RepID=UPI001DEA630E|nr:FAD-binding oxidoreductase [Microbacterium sp. Bi128]CAH0249705.1 6-hydroxy-D-nicotine oxidase [Microbacterium sp. Bi128]
MTTLPSSLVTVTPADDAYRYLRSTYTTPHSPAQILLPSSPSEVQQAMAYASGTDLPVSIRSGGHGLAGTSSNDGGIVVDLSRMDAVTVLDRPTGLVRVDAGARWAQIAVALAPHGLAISSGDHGNVGVGGLATAGGIGWLVRRYGLTIDHVRAATVVLPSGELVRADEANPDLLWAVRGAGSFVGVVTDLDIEAMELPGIQVGQVVIEIDRDGRALVEWSRFLQAAPRELTMSGVLAASGGRLVLVLTAVFAGTDAPRAHAALAPLLARPGVHAGGLQNARYTDLVPAGHLHANVGQQPSATTNALLAAFTAESAPALIEIARHPSGPFVQVRGVGGAAADIARDATAFWHRDAEVLVTVTLFPPRGAGELAAVARPLWSHALGAYRNFESHPSEATFARAFPGATGERVRELARRYDPDGVLHRVFLPAPRELGRQDVKPE